MKFKFTLIFLFALMIIASKGLYSQEEEVREPGITEAFDFWVGEWELHWMNADSSYSYGENNILKILDGNVIQENFYDPSSGFKGMSLSIFSLADSRWHQAWADNAGAYFDFYGIIEEDKRIFQTQPKIRQGVEIIQRMIFWDISENNFTWNWEISQDNGQNWSLNWQIFYERKMEE